MQELKPLSKTDVESQPQVDSQEEGSDKKNETEQVECVIKKARPEEHTATLDSLPPSTVKKEPTPPKSDDEPQPEIDSEEEEASDKEKETEQEESAKKKLRPVEQIESWRNLPLDEERHSIKPTSDVIKKTKQKREMVKKECATSTSSRQKERHAKQKNVT
jgi:hypothetical protein